MVKTKEKTASASGVWMGGKISRTIPVGARGYDEDEIEALAAEGVIGDTPEGV